LIHRAASIAAPHAVYNVGTGKALSLAALYGAICERMIARGAMPAFETPERKPRREGDIVHSLADIALARSELRFSPELGLAEGIDRFLGVEYGVEGRAAVAR
jgi:nucleoside-diphosphate-sugar epimerase